MSEDEQAAVEATWSQARIFYIAVDDPKHLRPRNGRMDQPEIQEALPGEPRSGNGRLLHTRAPTVFPSGFRSRTIGA